MSRWLEAGRAVRVDLGHEDWEDKVECPASPKALFKEVPDTPPSNASWDVIPANKPAITKMAADEVPPPRGPLTVVATTARKGPTAQDFEEKTKLTKPKLALQGSDQLVKRQFKLCAGGEIGFSPMK